MASAESEHHCTDDRTKTLESMAAECGYDFLNGWVKKQSFIDYIETNYLSSNPPNLNCYQENDKKPSFLNVISKYKSDKLNRNKINPSNFLNSSFSPIRSSADCNTLGFSGSLDHAVPINTIGGNRHFLKKFSKLLVKKPCKLEDQAEVWLVASGAADLLHKPFFEAYYEELCSHYDKNLTIQSQNITPSPTLMNHANIVSKLDSHCCQDSANKKRSNETYSCCSKHMSLYLLDKCHNPFCTHNKSHTSNRNIHTNVDSCKRSLIETSTNKKCSNNFICCLRGYVTIKKMVTVLKSLHPEISELSLLETICWITLHFFKREIELFAFLLSLLRSKHYDYFDQTVSQTIISSFTLRHLLQDFTKRNYSTHQLSSNPHFVFYKNLSKIRLPNDEFEYTNSNKPLDLNSKEFLLPKWKVFLLTNLSFCLQVRIINYFVVSGPGILFQTFMFYFSRLHDDILKNNINILKLSNDLHYKFYQNSLVNIISSFSNEDVFDQIVKVPVKTSRINVLYRIYFSYYNCGHIDSDLIKFLFKCVKRSNSSKNSSRLVSSRSTLKVKCYSIDSLKSATKKQKETDYEITPISSPSNSKNSSELSSGLVHQELHSPTALLKYNEWKELYHWIPYRIHLLNPICIFSTSEHGYNLKTLYHHCENSSPIIIFIHTKNNELFGAYISCKLNTRFSTRGFFGNGETFVFQLRPNMKKYIWNELINEKIKPTKPTIAEDPSHKRSRSFGFVEQTPKKVHAGSTSTLDLTRKKSTVITSPNPNRSNILSFIKRRFKSAFRFKMSPNRSAKSRSIADPSPALISMELDQVESNVCDHETVNASSAITPRESIFSYDPNKPNDQKIVLNDLFVSCDNSTIMIGGGREGFAIQLDANLLNGNSRVCDTFNNPSFVSGEEGDFVCTRVDVIGFFDNSTILAD